VPLTFNSAPTHFGYGVPVIFREPALRDKCVAVLLSGGGFA
jgi:hypothetical protein